MPLDWDWDAMAAVWATDENATVALEQALVGCGLIEWDEATRRYSLHATVHAFLEWRAVPLVYERHAAYYAELMRQCNRAIKHESTTDASLANLDREIGQMERGWKWTIDCEPTYCSRPTPNRICFCL